jgi:hypothetical protein
MTPYWLLAKDDLFRSAVIDSPEAFDKWIESAEPSFSITLMQESSEIVTLSGIEITDIDELIETIADLPSPDSPLKETFQSIYEIGDCDVFAVALQRIIGGEIYAVTDPFDERRNRARLPHLVHAGVYDGENVIDIEGATEIDSWSSRWRETGNCIIEGDTGPIDAKRLEKIQSTTHTPGQIYAATKIAWLIAALAGALNEEQLAQYRKMQT